jgi:bifunctional ADP-heptose synthase (sugar kinase/adenylyltransferase)
MSRVLLIGETAEDVYHYGRCPRLSPEAPVPVFHRIETVVREGMAANVRANLEAFGHEVVFITNPEPFVRTRYVDIIADYQLLRVDENPVVRPIEYPKPDGFDMVVISDYNKGLIPNLYSVATKFPVTRVTIDTKRAALIEQGNVLVKCNSTEMDAIESGIHCRPHRYIETLGAGGARWQGVHYVTDSVPVSDVTGAGDTFLAALVHYQLQLDRVTDAGIALAIDYANAAAGIAVQHRGTYVLTAADIQRLDSRAQSAR